MVKVEAGLGEIISLDTGHGSLSARRAGITKGLVKIPIASRLA
jgi:hypothetical protein